MLSRRTYSTPTMWFKLQIEALGPLIRQALETNDTEILRGLEALDVSLWTHIHGAESVISVWQEKFREGKRTDKRASPSELMIPLIHESLNC